MASICARVVLLELYILRKFVFVTFILICLHILLDIMFFYPSVSILVKC